MGNHDTPDAALQATYSDLKIIKTRDSFQIIFEMPLAEFNHAMAVLGGAPRPDREVWVAIARLNPAAPESSPAEPPAAAASPARHGSHKSPGHHPPPSEPAKPKEKRVWFDMPAVQRAAMRCEDHRFWTWLHDLGRVKQASEADVLDYVRRIAGGSRSNLGRIGFDKQTEAWDIVDHAYARHLDKQLTDSMR